MTAIDPGNPVVREIRRRARREPRRRRARYEAAALETGAVETGFREIPGGDADSQNWRQERESVYGPQWRRTGGPLNTRASVDRFFTELAQHDRGQPSYELAADVQRPAAQYRGRYREHHGAALALIHAGGSPRSGAPRGKASGTRTTSTSRTVFNPTATETVDTEGFETAQRRQKVAELLQRSGRGNSVLFRTGLLSTRPPDVADFTRRDFALTPQTVTSRRTSIAADGAPTGSGVSAAVRAATSYLGVKEVGQNNRGPEVDKLQKPFGMVGAPWCGIYVGTVLRKAGVKGVDSRMASVTEIERMARAKTGAFTGGWHSAAHARAGDALVTRRGEHVVYVTGVDPDGTIRAIGGNTGNGAVERRTYKPGEVFGVARPRYGTPRRARAKR